MSKSFGKKNEKVVLKGRGDVLFFVMVKYKRKDEER